MVKLRTEKWHNHEEWDAKISKKHKYKNYCYYKKWFWKRYDRKKYLKHYQNTLKLSDSEVL